jgi:hypothetical protein
MNTSTRRPRAKGPVAIAEQNADRSCPNAVISIGHYKVRYSVLIEIANGDSKGTAKGTGGIVDGVSSDTGNTSSQHLRNTRAWIRASCTASKAPVPISKIAPRLLADWRERWAGDPTSFVLQTKSRRGSTRNAERSNGATPSSLHPTAAQF